MAFTQGLEREDDDGNLLVRSAVERQFEIPGEVLRRLRAEDAALTSGISEHRRIIDFRNILAHGCDSIDDDVAWQAVTDKPPRLLAEAKGLLARLEGL